MSYLNTIFFDICTECKYRSIEEIDKDLDFKHLVLQSEIFNVSSDYYLEHFCRNDLLLSNLKSVVIGYYEPKLSKLLGEVFLYRVIEGKDEKETLEKCVYNLAILLRSVSLFKKKHFKVVSYDTLGKIKYLHIKSLSYDIDTSVIKKLYDKHEIVDILDYCDFKHKNIDILYEYLFKTNDDLDDWIGDEHYEMYLNLKKINRIYRKIISK